MKYEMKKYEDGYFYEKIISHPDYGGMEVNEITMEIYNDWLFKLAFKDVLGDDKE